VHRGHHPALPTHRPLAISHRGNSVAGALQAIELGADMVETDIWAHRGRLEVRHVKTMGPIPLLWDRWELHPGWGHRLVLEEMMRATPEDYPLFLDLKGHDLSLAPRIVKAIGDAQPDRPIVLCGRHWPQMEAVEADPDVWVFYSVGSTEELTGVWLWLARQAHPAISISYHLLSPKVIQELKDAGATIIAWTVNDPVIARDLYRLGVDGFTTDNMELLERIARVREHAFDDATDLAAATKGAS
jgi:glycerophosphoryl diester phosphodiesterase